MSDRSNAAATHVRAKPGLPLPRLLLAPLPLMLLQPLLGHIVRHVASRHPHVFARLGPDTGKRFVIDAEELPFVLYLRPMPHEPRLEACRREAVPPHDARICGAFLNLLDMVDGSLDGDALFFTRGLVINGDVEAVVRLRNALDDIDGSAIDTVLEAFGPLAGAARGALALIKRRAGRAA